jgi:hypothetical protein
MPRNIFIAFLAGLIFTILAWALPAKAGTFLEAPYNVGQPVDVISNTPTVQAAAYASGNLFGGKQVLTVLKDSNRSAVLRSALVTCKVAIATGFDLILFSSDPTNTTFTEKSAFAVAAADNAKVLGFTSLTTILATGTPSSTMVQGLYIPLVGDTTTRSIWAALIAKGATTPSGTTDCTMRLGVEMN